MIAKLGVYLQYPFIGRALIVGVLIALCSSLLGVTLVLKRFSFIGDGLSHVAFGAMAIAAVLNLMNEMMLVLPLTMLSAVLLLRTGDRARIKGDAAIAMISVTALAFGYLIMNIFSASSNLSGDVCSTLFGSTSILTLSSRDVWLCIILSILVIVLFSLFYNKIFAVTFDESFAKSTGINSEAYNLLVAVIVAVIIVLAMNLVGSLLISALVIFPALSAMRLFKSFRAVTVFSAVLSVICAFLGIISSILAGTPVGSTIVAADAVEPEENKGPEEITEKVSEGIDIDLTVLSGTMVYSEVYDMMYYPENYVGKTIKMEGLYATTCDDASGKSYHACIIQDATACCSQGIEFEPEEDIAYPDDFPRRAKMSV